MRSLPPQLARAHRALTAHLERLRTTLAALTVRLREAVAQAVGGTVAGAVREAVHALVIEPPSGHTPPPYRRAPPYRSPPAWGESRGYAPDDDPYDDTASADWRRDEPAAWRAVDEDEDRSAPPPLVAEPRRFRWHRALAVGCQAAAWWLRRQAGRCAALVALGIGLVAAGAAFTAGAGLAESALGLLTLADAVQPSPQECSFVDTR
jgi:hypothetical protein